MYLTLLVFCHFLADFTPLSTQYMLQSKKAAAPGGIFFHALVHGILMGVVSWWVHDIGIAVWVFAVITLTHFAIDMVQALVRKSDARFQTYEGRWYWFLLGIDQFLHIFVIITLVSYLRTHYGIKVL